MPEGFTPTFFLQFAMAVGGIVGAYYATKNKIDSIGQRLDDHITQTHADLNHRVEQQRESIHDIRDHHLVSLTSKVAKLEGFRDGMKAGNG